MNWGLSWSAIPISSIQKTDNQQHQIMKKIVLPIIFCLWCHILAGQAIFSSDAGRYKKELFMILFSIYSGIDYKTLSEKFKEVENIEVSFNKTENSFNYSAVLSNNFKQFLSFGKILYVKVGTGVKDFEVELDILKIDEAERKIFFMDFDGKMEKFEKNQSFTIRSCFLLENEIPEIKPLERDLEIYHVVRFEDDNFTINVDDYNINTTQVNLVELRILD